MRFSKVRIHTPGYIEAIIPRITPEDAKRAFEMVEATGAPEPDKEALYATLE